MGTIKIVPLGGVRENGKICTLLKWKMKFCTGLWITISRERTLGIDVVIPDFTYLEKIVNELQGSFNTWPC